MTGGATPRGASGEQDAARWVRSMFARVACRYDLLNHLLSFNLDRRWRARTAERLLPVLARPGARALDLCCGTGDLLLELAAARHGTLFGADFARPMLEIARRKLGAAAALVEGDALALPFPDGSLDVVSIAFGFRNLANYRKGLEEIWRVLRASGVAAILEFSRPRNRAFAALYDLYSRRVLRGLGGAISGAPDAYAYLHDSVREFLGAQALADEMRRAGFTGVEYELMSGGVVALHLGTKAAKQ